MIDIDTLWGQFKTWRVTYTLLILALLVLAFCNGPRAVWAQHHPSVVLCDDMTWLPRPCNDDAPLPEFNGDADKFTEWLLAHNADLLEHQEEPVRTALIEVIRSVGGMSYAVGYADGLKNGKK